MQAQHLIAALQSINPYCEVILGDGRILYCQDELRVYNLPHMNFVPHRFTANNIDDDCKECGKRLAFWTHEVGKNES